MAATVLRSSLFKDVWLLILLLSKLYFYLPLNSLAGGECEKDYSIF